MKINKFAFQFFFLLSLISYESLASHIKGGQIHNKHISGNTVEITFIGYRDIDGVPFGNGLLGFGDGSTFGGGNFDEAIPWTQPEDLGNGTEKWKFTISHTYALSGDYLISYTEENRNGYIANVQGSINTPFYIESLLILDPSLSNNSATNGLNPIFITPLDNKFHMSLDMQDEDGDSLSYSIVVPLMARETQISGYQFPSHVDFSNTSKSTDFGIDPLSGNLFWDQPSIEGEYLVALRVKEWRQINGTYRLVGYSIYDFNFRVIAFEFPPRITLPVVQCNPSEDGYSETIYIDNPSFNDLYIQIKTEINALKINGINVSDWNNDDAKTSISTQTIELLLEVDAQDLALYSGFNSVLMNMSFVSSDIEFHYTPVFNIGVNCVIPEIVTSTTDLTNQIDLKYSLDHIQLLSNQTGSHLVKIFDLTGKEMIKIAFEADSNSKLISYPFQKNTVYLIFAQNSSGTLTEKVIFK
jgi:hypothetical protein